MPLNNLIAENRSEVTSQLVLLDRADYRVWLSACLVAVPWLWPLLSGPLPAMWPDLVSWTVGALLIVLLPRTPQQLGLSLATGWLLAAVISSVLALLQYFDLENRMYPFVAVTNPGAAYANVHQPNMLATLLGVGLLSLVWLVQYRRLRFYWAWCLAFLLLLGLTATGSRTGVVHLSLIGFLLLYWKPWTQARLWWVLAIAVSFYLTSVTLLPWLLNLLLNVESSRILLDRMAVEATCSSRLVLWSNVLHLISLKPWTGWGMDGLLYAHYITPYEGARFCDKLSNAHNFYLQLAVEYGVPAAVLALCLSVAALFRLKPWFAVSPIERFGWGVLLLVGFHSMLEYPLWFGVFQLMSALAVLLVWSERHSSGTSGTDNRTMLLGPPVYLWLTTALSLTILAFVAYDYHRISQLYMPLEQRAKRYENNTFDQSRQTLLFKSHVLIAQVVATPIQPSNAELLLTAAQEALHIAPDSRVIQRLIEVAKVMDRTDLVQLHEARYQAAWPELYKEWKLGRAQE